MLYEEGHRPLSVDRTHDFTISFHDFTKLGGKLARERKLAFLCSPSLFRISLFAFPLSLFAFRISPSLVRFLARVSIRSASCVLHTLVSLASFWQFASFACSAPLSFFGAAPLSLSRLRLSVCAPLALTPSGSCDPR